MTNAGQPGLRAVATSQSARAGLAVVLRRRWYDAVTSLWFKPMLAMLGALALGVVLTLPDVEEGSLLWPVAFHGDNADARQLLVVVTGTMITVTSLVFALTVVTLQIASTQFSPRLLRTFLHDRGTQLVLSGFVGTVSYSMAGLFTVGTGNARVPRLAMTMALALALMSVGLLVYYIGHITDAIRIDSIMRRVERDTRQVLHRDHPVIAPRSGDPDARPPSIADEDSNIVPAARDGYVQGVDSELLALAVRKGLRVEVIPLIGYYVVRGRPIARVRVDDGSPLKATTEAAVAALVEIDPERRIEHDVGLGLRQLVDITNRAMSTGQNDPYTGTQAVHHVTSVLMDAAQRRFAAIELTDPGGQVRVLVPTLDFSTHLKVVCGHIRQGGLERHPRVVLELLRLLAAVAMAAISQPRLDAVARELEAVLADSQRQIPNPADLAEVVALGETATEAITRRRRELAGEDPGP